MANINEAQIDNLVSLLDGYTAQELSQMLNIPAGTIRSRLSRCRAYLKEQLQN